MAAAADAPTVSKNPAVFTDGTLQAFHGGIVKDRRVHPGLLEDLQPLPDGFHASGFPARRKGYRNVAVRIKRTELDEFRIGLGRNIDDDCTGVLFFKGLRTGPSVLDDNHVVSDVFGQR